MHSQIEKQHIKRDTQTHKQYPSKDKQSDRPQDCGGKAIKEQRHYDLSSDATASKGAEGTRKGIYYSTRIFGKDTRTNIWHNSIRDT